MKREKFEELVAVVDALVVARIAESNEWSEAGRKRAEADDLKKAWIDKWVEKKKVGGKSPRPPKKTP